MRRLIPLLALAIGCTAETATVTEPSFATAEPDEEVLGWCSAGLSEQGAPLHPSVSYTGMHYINQIPCGDGVGLCARTLEADCRVLRRYPTPHYETMAYCTQGQSRGNIYDVWTPYDLQPGTFSCVRTGG